MQSTPADGEGQSEVAHVAQLAAHDGAENSANAVSQEDEG